MSTSVERMPKPRVWRALLHKEWMETRSALLAGGVIFLGLPILWTVVYSLTDPDDEIVFGFAATLWLLFGWLFAAVLAAQSIVRDLGRRQGDFLLARPVRPSQVLCAKLVVGCFLLGMVMVGVVIWETTTYFQDPMARDSEEKLLALFSVFALVCSAYFLSSAATAVTRQTVSGVMLAALTLVWLATIPLVSSAMMEWLRQPYTHYHSSGTVTVTGSLSVGSWRFMVASLIAALVVAALCTSVMLATLRYEVVLRLGTRSVAWIVGLSMVLICSLAMTEVGASVPVADVIWRSELEYARSGNAFKFSFPRVEMGHRRLAVGMMPWMHMYEISDEGRIVHRESVCLIDRESGELAMAPHPVFDDQNQLHALLTFEAGSVNAENAGVLSRARESVWLQSIDWDSGALGSAYELALPDSIAPEARILAYDAAFQPPYLFVMYEERLPAAPSERYARSEVRVAEYGWAAEGPVLLRSELCGPGRVSLWHEGWTQFLKGGNRRIQSTGGWAPPPAPDAPEELALMYVPTKNATDWGLLELGDGYVASADLSGFRIKSYRPFAYPHVGPPPPRVRAVHETVCGFVAASPWARLFRDSNPWLVPGRSGQVWEVHYASAICYDVSEPTRPRKIAHVSCFLIEDAVSGPDYLLIRHYGGFSIVRHPE